MKVKANGITFNIEIDGKEGLPWIILSNSLATNLHMWDQQAEDLKGEYRVLRYDQRGHGQSSKASKASIISSTAPISPSRHSAPAASSCSGATAEAPGVRTSASNWRRVPWSLISPNSRSALTRRRMHMARARM